MRARSNERIDLYDLLDRSSSEHLIADVPVGLLLSGGLDSSVSLPWRRGIRTLRTISMGFADSKIDERPFARLVSEHIGSEHEEVVIQPREIAADLERSVWYVRRSFRRLGRDFDDAAVPQVPRGRRQGRAGRRRQRRALRRLSELRGAGARRSGGLPSCTEPCACIAGSLGGAGGVNCGALPTVLRSYRDADGDYFSTIRLFETGINCRTITT